MVKTIFHSFAALIRETLFLPLEDKIHIFAPPCNILYISNNGSTLGSILATDSYIHAMHNASRVASKRGRYRSHSSVAFYLRSSRNIALTKIHFKYTCLGLYSLEKEHKIAKINLGLSHRPCFDDSFPGPERKLGIMHSVYT